MPRQRVDSLAKFKGVYESWDGTDVKDFADKLASEAQINVPVDRHPLRGVNGQCRLDVTGPTIEVKTFELDSNDLRGKDYQVKTAFHELYHAKAHGLPSDIGDITFQQWAYVDDTFAEATAHYMAKSVGVSSELAPAYAKHLIDALPKLKQLPEFSACKTLADFGEVAYKFRFTTGATAQWKTIINHLDNAVHDAVEYSKGYIDYMVKNKYDLVDKFLENTPQYLVYRDNMVEDIERAIQAVNDGQPLTNNERMVFENALIVSMNRLGVK